MKLADYKTKDGWYEYAEIDYQNAGDLLMGMLGFCECGSPATVLMYIYDNLSNLPMTSNESGSDFFLYWADKEGLTEHGVSIYASWLSKNGEEFLGLLKEWNALPEADNE